MTKRKQFSTQWSHNHRIPTWSMNKLLQIESLDNVKCVGTDPFRFSRGRVKPTSRVVWYDEGKKYCRARITRGRSCVYCRIGVSSKDYEKVKRRVEEIIL